MKTCSKCGIKKPLENFAWKQKSKGYKAAACKACRKIYYKRDAQKERHRIEERKQEIKQWFWKLKSCLSCESCGEDHIATLQFHHLDIKNKRKDVSYMACFGYSKDSILKEISKCQVLCANCHCKVHYEEKAGIV